MDNLSIADTRRLAFEIVSSYENRISEVEGMFDCAGRVMEDFRTKRNLISGEMKETLAQGKHLRKKDFDAMTKDIFSTQEEQEKEVKALLDTYLDEQKDMAAELKKALSEGESPIVGNLLIILEEIRRRQVQMAKEAKNLLIGYRNEHEDAVKTLRGFLDKGEEVRIGDFKKLIDNIRQRQKERQDEVRGMLDGFRAKRKELHEGGDMEGT